MKIKFILLWVRKKPEAKPVVGSGSSSSSTVEGKGRGVNETDRRTSE